MVISCLIFPKNEALSSFSSLGPRTVRGDGARSNIGWRRIFTNLQREEEPGSIFKLLFAPQKNGKGWETQIYGSRFRKKLGKRIGNSNAMVVCKGSTSCMVFKSKDKPNSLEKLHRFFAINDTEKAIGTEIRNFPKQGALSSKIWRRVKLDSKGNLRARNKIILNKMLGLEMTEQISQHLKRERHNVKKRRVSAKRGSAAGVGLRSGAGVDDGTADSVWSPTFGTWRGSTPSARFLARELRNIPLSLRANSPSTVKIAHQPKPIHPLPNHHGNGGGRTPIINWTPNPQHPALTHHGNGGSGNVSMAITVRPSHPLPNHGNGGGRTPIINYTPKPASNLPGNNNNPTIAYTPKPLHPLPTPGNGSNASGGSNATGNTNSTTVDPGEWTHIKYWRLAMEEKCKPMIYDIYEECGMGLDDQGRLTNANEPELRECVERKCVSCLLTPSVTVFKSIAVALLVSKLIQSYSEGGTVGF